MFRFLHGYDPVLWKGYEKFGLIGENDGIRFVQNQFTPEEKGFNVMAAKGGALWNLIAEGKRPLYIDRLQGGLHFYKYDFDQQLLEEYRKLLGDQFLGFQIHEWMSNYRSDLNKCEEISAENWDAEHIAEVLNRKFPGKTLFLEAMSLEDFVAGGKVESARQFYHNMTAAYKKQVEKYKDVVAVDSGYVMYPFEAAQGANMIMPEIGAMGYRDVVLLMSFARAITKAHGIKFGAYYEPWGGEPFSACMYQESGINEWYIDKDSAFPYESAGENGGSSRSLQRRIYLYAYLVGTEYISEEWGAFNTFCDADCTVLSEYGKVKKEFIEFTRKYSDIGEKVAPIAVVLPSDLPTYVVQKHTESHTGDRPGYMYQFPLEQKEAEKLIFIKENVDRIFRSHSVMPGTEQRTLHHTQVPDGVDMLTQAEADYLEKYTYLVDLTCDSEFASAHHNLITADEVTEKLKELLPCTVEGGLHHLVNRRSDGGYYLTVFNHGGISRTVAEGERKIAEATVTATIRLKDETARLTLLEGDGALRGENGVYQATIPAGGYMFMELK